MGNTSIVDTVMNVGLNVVTGGLYGIEQAATSDHPLKSLMAQGLDLGMASTGNMLATDLGGPLAGTLFNAVGAGAGAIGGSGILSGADAALEGGADATLAGGADASLAGAGEATPISMDPTASISGTGIGESGLDMGAGMPGGDLPGSTLSGNVGAITPQAPLDPSASIAGDYMPGSEPPFSSPVSAADATGLPQAASANITNAGQLQNILASMPEGTAAQSSWWADLPPAAKAAVLGMGTLAAGQLVTGAASGIFQGISAQKKLALESLINQQNQAQRQYLNKNNSFAPQFNFQNVTGPAGKPTPKTTGIINQA